MASAPITSAAQTKPIWSLWMAILVVTLERFASICTPFVASLSAFGSIVTKPTRAMREKSAKARMLEIDDGIWEETTAWAVEREFECGRSSGKCRDRQDTEAGFGVLQTKGHVN